jgi:hypothetical protein
MGENGKRKGAPGGGGGGGGQQSKKKKVCLFQPQADVMPPSSDAKLLMHSEMWRPRGSSGESVGVSQWRQWAHTHMHNRSLTASI